MQRGDKLVYGLGPLYVVRADGTTLTFARDGGKSVRAELDATGAVSASFRYRAYGEVARSVGAAAPTYLGYAGQLVGPSGLLYMRARWYDPATGRFLTRDPLDGDLATPPSLNAYAYAYGNPVRFSDPSGECPICLRILEAVSGLAQRFGPTIQSFLPWAQRVAPAAERAFERLAEAGEEAELSVSETAITHIVERHGSAAAIGASRFASGIDIVDLIQRASAPGAKVVDLGRGLTARIVAAEQPVGVDAITGLGETSIYTVVLRGSEVVTAYPGVPQQLVR